MKFYHYEIADKKILSYNGEIPNTSFGFRHYQKTSGVEEIYYKERNGSVSAVICQAPDEISAKKAVDAWLDLL